MRTLTLLPVLSFLLATAIPALAGFEAPDPPSEISPSTTTARPWDLSARFYVGQNSNVPLVPDVSFHQAAKDSRYQGVTVTGTFRFLSLPDLTAGAIFTVDRLVYNKEYAIGFSDAPHEYTLTVINPGVFAVRRFAVYGMAAELEARYNQRQERLRIDHLGSNTHMLSLKASIKPTYKLILSAQYSYNDSDSKVIFPDPDLNDRDGDLDSITFACAYSWDTWRRTVSASYSRAENSTVGSNFDYTANIFTVQFETLLVAPFWLTLEAGLDQRDYNGFASGFIPPPGRTFQDIYHRKAQLLVPIGRHLVADFYYHKTIYEANLAQFEAEREHFGMGLSYRF